MINESSKCEYKMRALKEFKLRVSIGNDKMNEVKKVFGDRY